MIIIIDIGSFIFWKSLKQSLADSLRVRLLSQEEINEVSRELQSLSVNPNACMSVIVSNWGNVQGAIAYLKEALQK